MVSIAVGRRSSPAGRDSVPKEVTHREGSTRQRRRQGGNKTQRTVAGKFHHSNFPLAESKRPTRSTSLVLCPYEVSHVYGVMPTRLSSPSGSGPMVSGFTRLLLDATSTRSRRRISPGTAPSGNSFTGNWRMACDLSPMLP